MVAAWAGCTEPCAKLFAPRLRGEAKCGEYARAPREIDATSAYLFVWDCCARCFTIVRQQQHASAFPRATRPPCVLRTTKPLQTGPSLRRSGPRRTDPPPAFAPSLQQQQPG